jgi:hypothetical protein
VSLTAEIQMSRMGEYEDWPTLCKYLASQLIKGRFALVLGAGTSVHFGLPSWKELIVKLFAGRNDTPPNEPETFQAEAFRHRYHHGVYQPFVDEVKQVLYDGVTIGFDEMMSHHVLAGVLSILMAAGPISPTEVITFNWDNLLEKYLALHGRVVAPIYEERHWAQSADVSVFHPHGYLPYKESTSSSKLIFDQLSYDEILGKDTIWRQVLAGLFRTRTCVLIGLSVLDPDLRSLLVRVKEEHASRNSQTRFWAVTFTDEETSKQKWQDRGVYPIILKNYGELPPKLFAITEEAVRMRAK